MGDDEASHSRFMHDALAHADALYNFAHYLSRNAVEAEDLVQETYARALAAAGQFVAGTHLKAWLFRITRNTFIDLHRRDQRARTDGGLDTVDEAPLPVAGSAGELPQEREIASHELERAIRLLNEDARMALLLDLEGLSEAEIAGCLGCAPGTVKSRLFRARAALRERLRDRG